jgi:MFS family permease
MRRRYGLDSETMTKIQLADLQANIVTTLQCGCFVGALCTGVIADRIGRRYNLILAAILAIIGTIMQAAASGHIAAIFVGRFIAGLGVGAASMVTPLYSKLASETPSHLAY